MRIDNTATYAGLLGQLRLYCLLVAKIYHGPSGTLGYTDKEVVDPLKLDVNL